jgi:hypothetical protein
MLGTDQRFSLVYPEQVGPLEGVGVGLLAEGGSLDIRNYIPSKSDIECNSKPHYLGSRTPLSPSLAHYLRCFARGDDSLYFDVTRRWADRPSDSSSMRRSVVVA